MRITVVGLGKIGLPLAVQYARKGHTVFGADINERAVSLVNDGVEPFPGEAFLYEYLPEVVNDGRLSATVDTEAAVRESDVVVVVVPLFVDEDAVPDFRAMDSATEAIAGGLKPGTLISYETTLPVGTTRNRLVPILERGSGLKGGKDFFVVFSPERVLTGRVFADLRRYPKLVGGIDWESEQRGLDFYSKVLDFDPRDDLERPNGVWAMGSAEAAELAKLAETTYRDVNIALANQFARFAEANGIDVHAVIDACNSQPYSHIHQPGIAVGGHCIPVYPRLYLWNDPEATVVRAAREANSNMPEVAVARVEAVFGPLENARVAVLGAAYRGGVKETAFSGVFGIVDSLRNRGAEVFVHDPMFSDTELSNLGLTAFHRGDPADVIIVQADHAEYRDWRMEDVPGVSLALDGRNLLAANLWGDPSIIMTLGKADIQAFK
jgi:nucleotide sugar dehydrogenase